MEGEEFSDKLNVLEEKWQEKWNSQNLHEVEPDEDREKFFITVAYPYPSGGMHVGHVGTYTLPDVFARYKRMQGFNVLFPMAWHVTGTPIIGALSRLKEGDEDQITTLRDVYNVPEEELESWEEPMDYANHFIENSYRPNMKRLGYSVDWRREFTTNDERYQKFIEWQYRKLREKGYLKQGMHPVKYCTDDENPVTTHDLLEGEDAEKQDYTLVKFSDGEYVYPFATLRPETVYGVTHTLIDPQGTYKVAEVDGEKWVISEEAEEKLNLQEREVRPLSREKGSEFVGNELENPVTGENVLMLPALFVDTDSGTGLVMSVPAHAPYDWISLQDLKEGDEMLIEYGVDPSKVRNIEPKKIISVEGYDGFPAEEACQEHGVTDQEDVEALEEATDEVYEKEFHRGVLNAKCGEFADSHVSDVKERMRRKFEDEGKFSQMYDFSEPVRCRCGGKVVVSQQESWFLEYGDRGWKDRVSKLIDSAEIVPENKTGDYNHTVDWLESWPCIRNFGLGTRLPFDDDFIIEPLSDSTIYMAYYTIEHIVEEEPANRLSDEFFDHVFYGDSTAEHVSEHTGIPEETVQRARESFEYWYPLDWRTTSHEHIQNHLSFMMFHHAALFPEKDWPQGVATWGMGLLEGKKMSSSKGHVVLTDNAIDRYGADTVRLFIFASREPWQDFDWRSDELERYRDKLRAFYNRSLELHGSGTEGDMSSLDEWALSRRQKVVEEATEAMEDFQTRKAGLNAFFELSTLINKYRRRSDGFNEGVMNELVETQVRLMAPFTPHICEELWSQIGGEGLVSEAEWPEPLEEMRNVEAEQAQQLVDATLSDIREVVGIVDEEFDQIRVIVAEEWKRELFQELKDVVEDRPEFGEAMDRLTEGREQHAERIKELLQEYLEDPGELPEKVFSTDREEQILEENQGFIEDEFDSWVKVERESESGESKASRAEPGRPAIVLE